MPTLPTNRDASSSTADHVSDHNALHALYTAMNGTPPTFTTPPHPDDIPASPNAADYEFNGSGSSLPTGWSWVNQGTSTYAEANGYGSLDFQAGGADESRGIVRAVPAGASSASDPSCARNDGLSFPADALKET